MQQPVSASVADTLTVIVYIQKFHTRAQTLEGKKTVLLLAIHSRASVVEQFCSQNETGDVSVINSVQCAMAKGN